MRRWSAALLLAFPLPAAGLAAQQPPRMLLDGAQLPEAALQLDPFGTLLLRGRRADGEFRLGLRFRPFALPDGGDYPLTAEGDPAAVPLFADVLWPGREPLRLAAGRLRLAVCSEEQAAGELEWSEGDAEHRLQFAGRPELFRMAPPVMDGARALPEFPPPIERPSREDVVFAVLGFTGSGLSGQRQVAKSLAELAPSGPLDFVLLLGETFLPDPPPTTTDRLWRSRFESVYDPRKLAVPFWVTLGPNEYAKHTEAIVQYGRMNERWSLPRFGFDFKVESHGQKLHFFGLDTNGLLRPPVEPTHRIAHRMFVHFIEPSDADWRIGFGYHALHSNGASHDSTDQKTMREAIEHWFDRFDLDVYFSAQDRTLELLTPKRGVTHVVSGAGGGPELAGPLTWREDTVFGHIGGGFVWCRFDGQRLELSFRDAAGKVLFVHHLTKEGR
jgi:hypothetical protein